MFKYIFLPKRYLLLIRLIKLFFVAFCMVSLKANAAEPSWQGVLRGTIGKHDVMVCLNTQPEPSSYFYEAHKSTIELSRIDDEWEERIKGGLTGVWKLSDAQGDAMEGRWKNPETQRTLPIKLKRIGSKCPDGIYSTKLYESASTSDMPNDKGIPGLENVRDISSSAHRTCALLSDGNVKCWGMPTEKNELVFDDKKTHGIDAMTFHGQFDDVLCLVSSDKKVSCTGENLHTINFDNLGMLEDPHVVISGMGEFVCAVSSEGRVQCAGKNQYGQLGDGSMLDRQTPVFVKGISDAEMIALSDTGGCAVLKNGHVKCWGRDIWSGAWSDTVEIKGLSNVKTVTVEEQKACATLRNGKNKCWGINLYSGDTPDDQISSKSPIDTDENVSIQTGYETQCKLEKNKKVMCGSVIVSGLSGVKKLSGTSFQVCALLSNSHVKCWNPEQFSKAGVTAGESGLVIFDGEKKKVNRPIGANDYSLNGVWRGQVGFNVERYVKNIILCLSTSEQSVYHDLHDGIEITLNRNDASWVEKSNGLVSAVWKLKAVQGDHLDGVRTDTEKNEESFSLDRVREWPGGKTPDCNSEAYKPQQSALPSSKAVPSAEYAVATDGNCIVMNTGTVKCWGDRYGNGNNFVPSVISGISDASIVAGDCVLLHTGTVQCFNFGINGYLDGRKTPMKVSSVENAISLVSGNGFNCALIRDGKVKCWGDNHYGQLGTGLQASDGEQENTVSSVKNLDNVVKISAGYDNACAVLKDGNVWCWGNLESYPMRGEKGQDANHNSPVLIKGVAGAISVASGGYFECALLANHSVKCWDDIEHGWQQRDKVELGSKELSLTSEDAVQAISKGASLVHHAVSLSAGDNYACALLQNGMVECWGKNFEGALGDGTVYDSTKPVKVVGVFDATALVTYYQHSCVLIRDGSVKCWGQSPLGDGLSWPRFNTAVNVRIQ